MGFPGFSLPSLRSSFCLEGEAEEERLRLGDLQRKIKMAAGRVITTTDGRHL